MAVEDIIADQLDIVVDGVAEDGILDTDIAQCMVRQAGMDMGDRGVEVDSGDLALA